MKKIMTITIIDRDIIPVIEKLADSKIDSKLNGSTFSGVFDDTSRIALSAFEAQGLIESFEAGYVVGMDRDLRITIPYALWNLIGYDMNVSFATSEAQLVVTLTSDGKGLEIRKAD